MLDGSWARKKRNYNLYIMHPKKRLEVLHYLIHHLGAASNSLASTNEQLKLRELIDIAMTFLEPSGGIWS